MCDDTTRQHAADHQADHQAGAQPAPLPGPDAYPGLVETMVGVPTPDGTCDAFFVHPAEGRHPGVILWPDAIGLRDAKRSMARRLAAEGYAVLAVNPFYRLGPVPLPITMDTWRTKEGLAWIMPILGAMDGEALARDAKALVAFLDAQAAVDPARGIARRLRSIPRAASASTAIAWADRSPCAPPAPCRSGSGVSPPSTAAA